MKVSAWSLIAWFIAAMTISWVPAFDQTSADKTDSPAVSNSGPSEAPNKAIRVYMPDGQLKSHSIRIYVTKNIYLRQNPQLELLRNNAKSSIDAKAKFVAPNQEWIEVIDGQQVAQEGTLMLFDINSMSFGCKSMIRVTPVVSWNIENNEKEKTIDIMEFAIGNKEVNVGNITVAIIWTIWRWAESVDFLIFLDILFSHYETIYRN